MKPQEIAVNTLPFWSRFVLEADLRYDGILTFRTILATGRNIPVFDYRKGEANVNALAGASATARDTILVTASQTRGGGIYHIEGLSITKDGMAYEAADTPNGKGLLHRIFPASSSQPANGGAGPLVMSAEDWRALDSFMAHLFVDNFRVQINVDGTRRILEMGAAPFYPGVGGVVSDIDATNGQAFVSNFMAIPEGIAWNPAGTVDSNVVVNLEATYQVDVPTWTAPDGLAPDGTPILNAIPTALGRKWSQGWLVNFHGWEESPTSNVS